jgi:NAD(P)-dependent dehydrogenase (short-subunit alcohol dehydrogenase family)
MARPQAKDNSAATRKDADAGAQTAERQRRLQRQQDAKDQNKDQAKAKPHSRGGAKTPVQTSTTQDRPGTPLPRQHLKKPGSEAQMQLKPQYIAADYEGSHKLRGMTALITGGDSGIGRAVAVLYAREGADVAIVYLDEHEDAEETRRLVEKEGQRCLLIAGDVKDAAFCRDAVRRTVEKFDTLEILVNNAAFHFHMAQAALPHLRRGASIINTGSVVGLRGSSHLLDYSTTKGAIHAFTKALASNLVDKGIRVNAVAPGPVWTPLNPADQTPENIATFGGDTDMKRPAQPDELSPAYVFLASPACASYITGIVLPVTGSVGAI